MPDDFDIVITSLGNTFYQTNAQSGFEWKPTAKQTEFIQKLNVSKSLSDKDFAFYQMYAAASSDLAIHVENEITCTRQRCPDKKNCGFIPNYPIIEFEANATKPTNRWFSLEDSEQLFLRIIHRK